MADIAGGTEPLPELVEGKDPQGIITVRIPRRLQRQVQTIAQDRRQSMNGYVRQLLELAVQQATATPAPNQEPQT